MTTHSDAMTEIELVLDARAELGEGPIWDDRRQRLVWVDIMRGEVHEFDPVTRQDRVLRVGRPVGCVALAARGDWIVGAADGFHRLDPASGRLTPIAAVEADRPDHRMNDGYVDARGRLWAGTMALSGAKGRGTLYRLDPDGRVHAMVSGVTISNGIDWSPDNRLMYYVDLALGCIDVFDFTLATGVIANRRTFVEIPAEVGHPDGLVVDVEGSVWVALWEGGSLHRYAPDGQLQTIVPVPASLTTKCAFGGADLADLYVTTARGGLDPAAAAAQPHAGGLFRLRPGVRGKPACRFAG